MSEKRPRPYKHPQINLRIPEDLKEKVQKLADKNNRSMNAEIIHILEQYSSSDKRYSKQDVLEYINTALNKFEELVINHSDKIKK